jgi:hypothetical protein
VRPEELCKLKKITSSGVEPATFQLVTQCLKHYATACPNNSLHRQDKYKSIVVSYVAREIFEVYEFVFLSSPWKNEIVWAGWDARAAERYSPLN